MWSTIWNGLKAGATGLFSVFVGKDDRFTEAYAGQQRLLTYAILGLGVVAVFLAMKRK